MSVTETEEKPVNVTDTTSSDAASAGSSPAEDSSEKKTRTTARKKASSKEEGAVAEEKPKRQRRVRSSAKTIEETPSLKQEKRQKVHLKMLLQRVRRLKSPKPILPRRISNVNNVHPKKVELPKKIVHLKKIVIVVLVGSTEDLQEESPLFLRRIAKILKNSKWLSFAQKLLN